MYGRGWGGTTLRKATTEKSLFVQSSDRDLERSVDSKAHIARPSGSLGVDGRETIRFNPRAAA